MSITAPEFSEILEEFIAKFGNGIIDTKMGKSMDVTEGYLLSIKNGIDHLVANTGPNGTITPAILSGLMTQQANLSGGTGSSNNSSSGSSGSSNRNDTTTAANNTILEDFGKTVDNTKSKTSRAFSALGKGATSLKESFRLLTSTSELLMKNLDNDNKLYGSLVTRGMAWSSSAAVMADNVNKAGFTVETFTKLLNEGSAGVRALGGNNFLHLASSVEKANSRLGDFGLGAEEYYRQLSSYSDYMRVSGNLQELTNRNVGDSFHELLGKTIALTGAFGVSIDQFMKVKQQLTTNQVDYSLVQGAAQRTGVSEDELRSRISMLTNRYGADFANSTLRRLNGGTDANYAMNRETIDAATRYASASNDRDAYNRLNEVQSIGLRRANIDSRRINPVAGSYIQDTEFGRLSFGTDTAFRNAQGMNHMTWDEYQRSLRNLNSPDLLRDASQGNQYAVESRNATTQGLTNHALVDFQQSLGSAISIINNVYTERYPKLAQSIDKVTDRLGKFDGAMASFINRHSDVIGNTLAYGTAFNQVVSGTVIGGIGLAGANTLRRHAMRTIRNRFSRPSTTASAAADDATILENGLDGAAGGARRGLGRFASMSGRRLLGRAALPLGAALSAYEIYHSTQENNDAVAHGRETAWQGGENKFEAWGKSIGGLGGGILGGIGGSFVAPGVGTAAGAVGGGIAGEQIGDYIARKSYQLIYGNSPISTLHPNANGMTPSVNQDHNVNTTNNIPTQQHADDNRNILLVLTRVEQLLVELNRTSVMMSRNLGNISPYTSP